MPQSRGHPPNALAGARRSLLVAGARVSAAARVHPEPVHRFAPGTGSGVSEALRPELERVLAWAGDDLVALVLAGSHASGEAVWAEVEGRRGSLSDLDLYALLRDDDACARARARARAERAGAVADSALMGPPMEPPMEPLMGPLEVAWLTPDGLARMPARPGTLELARTARVLAGDPAVLGRLPRWDASAVSAEERLLLLENRAFELLWAWLTPPEPWPALRARHAVLKTALEVAGARLLANGQWPAGVVARVEAARSLAAPSGLPSWLEGGWEGLEPVWAEALEWRAADARVQATVPLAGAWHATVRGWAAVWWGEAAPGREPNAAFDRAARAARRGSFARRIRRSLAFRANAGGTPGVAARLRLAARGAPTLRIHGSAVTLLLAAASAPSAPRLSGEALHALAALGVTRATTFTEAARDLVEAWDRALHDGLRTGGAR